MTAAVEHSPGLRARPGDRLVIHGHRLGEPERDGEILEARGGGGAPPFLVRWEDTGNVTLLFPGSDAYVDHLDRGRRRAPRASAERRASLRR